MDLYYSNEKKAILVVHPFISKGSLKDYIHRTSPTCTYEKKYRLDYSYPVRIGEIRHYGAQILDALIALRSKKIVCEHLSTSNILLDNGNAK
jgi:serine/threonine protein kinase